MAFPSATTSKTGDSVGAASATVGQAAYISPLQSAPVLCSRALPERVPLVVVAAVQHLDPLTVVLLKAEQLDALGPLRLAVVLLLQGDDEVEDLVGRGQHGPRLGVRGVPAALEDLEDPLGCVRLPQHHLGRLLLEEEAAQRVEELHHDVAVVLLLREERGEDRWDLGGREEGHAVRVQGKDAHEDNALQEDVVLGEADDQEPVHQVKEASIAELWPRNGRDRTIQACQRPHDLDQHLRAIRRAARQPRDIEEPICMPLGGLHCPQQTRPHGPVGTDVPQDLEQQGVTALQGPLRETREVLRLNDGRGGGGLCSEVHAEGLRVPLQLRLLAPCHEVHRSADAARVPACNQRAHG
mmetsp:Transcript_843/g.2897  ORF Transcript_843/g.2897 Transcript_843/m.2897 type:complete len:354 (-) Transcript_843:813-1874(-)